ncbi:hypothetical protein ETH_00033765, partial [Eimeria tenella]
QSAWGVVGSAGVRGVQTLRGLHRHSRWLLSRPQLHLLSPLQGAPHRWALRRTAVQSLRSGLWGNWPRSSDLFEKGLRGKGPGGPPGLLQPQKTRKRGAPL